MDPNVSAFRPSPYRFSFRSLASGLSVFSGRTECMDEESAIQEIRKNPRLKQVPVVFITGQTFETSVQRTIESDIQEFLPKPFTVDDLIQAIEKAIKRPLPPKKN